MLTDLESGDFWISGTEPRMVSHNSGHSETTRANTSVTYVSAFTNFYGGFAVPTHALCGYKSGYSEKTCGNAMVTYVIDFSYFYWCAKRIRIRPLSICSCGDFFTSQIGVPPDMPPLIAAALADARFLRKGVNPSTIWFEARRDGKV